MIICGNLWARPDFWDDRDDAELIEEILAAMTPVQLLGQTHFCGYLGTEPSDEIKRWIGRRGAGGVKIFGRNVSALETLAQGILEMQTLAEKSPFSIPLFIATDQEGGWVRHVQDETLVVPGNLALGATTRPIDSYYIAYYMGLELSLLGINLNFAPSIDIYSNLDNQAIGPRSFSSDPVITGILGTAFMQGMKDAGVLCTAKHFPGHGDAIEDSHGVRPKVDVDLETLRKRELVPYRFMFKAGVPVIMTAHLAFPKITGNNGPATLSSFFLEDIARKELGYQGIILTDDLEMQGVHEGAFDLPKISYQALLAGNDMILLSHTPREHEKTWKFLNAQLTNQAFLALLKTKVRRILKVKMDFFKHNKPVTLKPQPKGVVKRILDLQKKASLEYTFEVSCRAVTTLADKSLPFQPTSREKILMVSQYREFFKAVSERFFGVEEYYLDFPSYYTPPERVLKELSRKAENSDKILLCLANPGTLAVLEALRSYSSKLFVVSTLTPAYLKDVPWVENAVAIFGTNADSFRAGIAVLAGDYKGPGSLPFQLEMDQSATERY